MALLSLPVFAQSGDDEPVGGHSGGFSGGQPKVQVDPETQAQQELSRLAYRVTLTELERDSLLSFFTVYHKGRNTLQEDAPKSSPEFLDQALDAKVKSLLDGPTYLDYQDAKMIRPEKSAQKGKHEGKPSGAMGGRHRQD